MEQQTDYRALYEAANDLLHVERQQVKELNSMLADAQATIAALQARVQELEESRDAWKASQECSEKAYMALVNQIPAERFDYDPVNVALLDGAKEQEIIGRKQIADLQGLLKRTDENREQWRKLCQEAQSQLTQRTAELEAAKRQIGEDALWNAACEQKDTLQAELERVRGERDEDNKIGLPVIVELLRQADKGQDGPLSVLKGIIAERDTLRADHARVLGLVRALPKMEHSAKVVHDVDEHDYEQWKVRFDGGPFAEDLTKGQAEALKQLLEYRASLPAQPAQGGAKCVWVDDGGGTYATGCKEYFQVYAESEEAPQWVKFCCYCGKSVEHFEDADAEGETRA